MSDAEQHRPLAGRHAVVTGAGRGIGAAIAAALVGAGARVTLLGRGHAALELQHGRLSALGEVAIATCDVAQAEQVAATFATIRATAPIDILVNNAGVAESAPFDKTDPEMWGRLLAVNLTGTYLCCREVVAAMSAQGFGRIVNVASTAGLVGYAYVSAYVAAKHGVVGLTRALAIETARRGVTVNAVCPGYTETDIVDTAIANIMAKTGKSRDDSRAALTATNPQGRLVQPEEVAAAVLWLCLPGSAAVTGQAISVSGGEVMR